MVAGQDAISCNCERLVFRRMKTSHMWQNSFGRPRTHPFERSIVSGGEYSCERSTPFAFKARAR